MKAKPARSPVRTEAPAPPQRSWPCLSGAGPQGVVLALSVVPNGRCTEVLGLHGDTLRVRLAAPPVDGKANELLVAWLAEQLGLPRSAVQVATGEHSRRKRVQLDLAESRLVRWLQDVVPNF